MSDTSLRVRRRAQLVYLVTDEFKSRLQRDLVERIDYADRAIEITDSMLNAVAEERIPDQARLKSERDRLIRSRESTAARLAQLKGVSVGSEIVEGTIEIESEIAVGDNESRLRDAQVVIQDGIVVDLRNL